MFQEAIQAQVVLEMSAANRPFEHHQDVCIYLTKCQKHRKMIEHGYCKALSLDKKVC